QCAIARRHAFVFAEIRNFRAGARAAVEGPAVVGTLQAIGFDAAQRQRCAAVRTAIFQRDGFAAAVAEQHDFVLIADDGEWFFAADSFAESSRPPVLRAGL